MEPILITFEPLKKFDLIGCIAIGISLLTLITSWFMSKKNIKKMQEQLDQNIFPDLIINTAIRKIDISGSQRIKIPLANIGLGVATDFGYEFEISEIQNQQLKDIISNISLNQKQKRNKFINFLLPYKNSSDESSLTIYSEYIYLLKELFKQDSTLDKVPSDFPPLSIKLKYKNLEKKQFSKLYELKPKIRGERDENLITFKFNVTSI